MQKRPLASLYIIFVEFIVGNITLTGDHIDGTISVGDGSAIAKLEPIRRRPDLRPFIGGNVIFIKLILQDERVDCALAIEYHFSTVGVLGFIVWEV